MDKFYRESYRELFMQAHIEPDPELIQVISARLLAELDVELSWASDYENLDM